MTTEEKIWAYLDGDLDDTSRREIEHAIAHDATIASMHREISVMHGMLKAQPAEYPSLAFTDLVMSAMAPKPVHAPVRKVSIIPVLVAALPFLALLSMLSLILLGSNSPLSHSVPINSHFINIIKLAFILIDSVLLILFIEEWLHSKKKYLA